MNFDVNKSFGMGVNNSDIYDSKPLHGIDFGPVYGENLEYGGYKSLVPEPVELVFQPFQPPMGVDQMQAGINRANSGLGGW
jgi:hypothetical protein